MKCCDVSGLLNKHRQERREGVQVEKMKQDITIIIEVNYSSFSSLEIIFFIIERRQGKVCSDKLRHPNTFLVSFGEHVCPRTHAELRGQLVYFPLSSCKSWGCNSGHGPWRWTPVPTEHFGEPNLLISDEINTQTNKQNQNPEGQGLKPHITMPNNGELRLEVSSC